MNIELTAVCDICKTILTIKTNSEKIKDMQDWPLNTIRVEFNWGELHRSAIGLGNRETLKMSNVCDNCRDILWGRIKNIVIEFEAEHLPSSLDSLF